MQFTIRPSEILSRVAAVLLVGLLVAYIAMVLGELEVKDTARMSHQELVKYIKEGHDPNYLGNYLQVILISAVYVLAVEGVAFILRLGVAMLFPQRRSTQEATSWQ